MGAVKSTPLGIIAAENRPKLAGAVFNHRQARFAQRYLPLPRDHQGREEMMERQRAPSSQDCGEQRPCAQERGDPNRCQTECCREAGERHLDGLRGGQSWDALWTDRSRLDSGKVGAPVVWKEGESCECRTYYFLGQIRRPTTSKFARSTDGGVVSFNAH